MKSHPYLSLILLILSLFILSACAQKSQESESNVPEVMLGTDCGFDRLRCCTSTPVCNYGQQCCVSPNDASQNYCADNCHCGDNEEFCCAGNKCNGQAVCVKGICAACGDKDEACCATGSGCSANLICQNNECVACGLGGDPCCAGSVSCTPITGQRSECLKNICVACGFDGNPPCTTGDKCLPGQIFAGKTCERCGQENEPCCDKASGENYDCDPNQALQCKLGFCSPGN
jgi:hypothetical protein